MTTPLLRLIERCRRQQQQLPGQLEIPDVPNDLLDIYMQQSDFMLTLRAATSEPLPASEHEALQEWRSRTVEDWGVQRDWL
jgi:hypothetical protein